MTAGVPDDPLLVVPRARIADALRLTACLVLGLPFAIVGLNRPEVAVIAVFLLGYALSLGLKIADARPAFSADRTGLTIFRWPGASVHYTWPQITEISFLKMRVKHVVFIKSSALPPYVEVAGFDFRGSGPRVAEDLRKVWEAHR